MLLYLKFEKKFTGNTKSESTCIGLAKKNIFCTELQPVWSQKYPKFLSTWVEL